MPQQRPHAPPRRGDPAFTGNLPAYRPDRDHHTGSFAAVQTGAMPRIQRSRVVEASERPRRMAGRGRAGRPMLVLLFWAGLTFSLLPWWWDTAAGSVTDAAAAYTAGGQITGMIAGYLLLIQILLMSRVGWLERSVGAAEVLGWHRDLGALLLVVVLAHASLITVGYAALDGATLLHESRVILGSYEDMISAYLATGILTAVGVMAIRRIKNAMPYELWYYLHTTSYLVLLLGYGHQFAGGANLLPGTFGRYYWTALNIFVVLCLVWGRVILPLRLNLRHRLRVLEVVHEGPDIFSIYVHGRRLSELQAQAGQFFRWRFMTGGCWWQAHPFSLSAAPNDRWLRVTVKAVGDHTEQLRWLDPGVRVFIEGPSGAFTASRRTRNRALLIAAGSGIAPIRALLEDLPRGAVVLYRASTVEDLIFRRELDWLAEARAAEVWYILGGRDDPAPRRAMSPRGMRELVPDVAGRDVYLCGPEGMVSAAVATLRKLRVPRRQIHLDPFEF
ncbi:ferredoxin reductase family protein [Catellatospora chokoriensis]|uniref:ferredoxin reductase family protein n=1 Tax=Catellatospora chokoriensis TaxID=310353 RepID=UPI00177DDFFE|nr:ferredoxin reductase family protein [Catellatospora chokoriensis]